MCKSKVSSYCWLLVLATGSASAQTAGISAASAFVAGQTVTIQGAGFGVKTNPAPLYFWDFGNGSTQSSRLSRSSYSDVIRGSISKAMVAPGSTTALQVEMGAGIEHPAGPQNGVAFTSSSAYAWIKHLYNFNVVKASGPNGFNLKVFRLWYPWTHDIYVAYQGSGASLIAPENTQNGALWFHWLPKQGDWVVDEYDYQTGNVDATDGILNYFRNGIAAWPTSSRFLMRTSAKPEPYQLLFFDQVSNNEVAAGTYQYIDSIYVDDSRQRVILSTEAKWNTQVNFGTESDREIQIPVTWTDTQIEIVARQGSLDSLAGKYLYVIGTDGNPISSSGFKVAGGSPATGSPAAPTKITVH